MKIQVDVKSLCAGILFGVALVLAMGASKGAQSHNVTLTIKNEPGASVGKPFKIRMD